MALRPIATSPDVIVMTQEEIRHNIDLQARKQLGMSGDRFIELWLAGELPHTPASWDIGILVSLLRTGKSERPERPSR